MVPNADSLFVTVEGTGPPIVVLAVGYPALTTVFTSSRLCNVLHVLKLSTNSEVFPAVIESISVNMIYY